MKPVFFPFTCISETVFEGLRRFFDDVVVIQATGDAIPDGMKAWQAAGGLEIWTPPAGDADIGALLRDYRTWAQFHQGGDLSVFKYSRDRVPFFNDVSVSQIKKEIRTAAGGGAKVSTDGARDLLIQARLFLQMAQEFDEQNLEIADSLQGHEKLEQGLFESLRGEVEEEASLPDDVVEPMSGADRSFSHMLSDRLSAWARVMLSRGVSGGVFITSSRDVLDSVLDAFVETEPGIHIQMIGGFAGEADACAERRQALRDYLMRLLQTPLSRFQEHVVAPFTEARDVGDSPLELFTIPGIAPPDFLAALLHEHSKPAAGDDRSSPEKNTVIGLLEVG